YEKSFPINRNHVKIALNNIKCMRQCMVSVAYDSIKIESCVRHPNQVEDAFLHQCRIRAVKISTITTGNHAGGSISSGSKHQITVTICLSWKCNHGDCCK